MKRRRRIIGIIAALIAAIIIIALLKEKKQLEIITDTVKSGVVHTTVTSTGYIQPVKQVSVGTQVSGIVDSLYVDFNSVVKKGQLLATLDMSVLNQRLLQAQASLSSMKSATLLAQQTYDRTKALFDKKAETQTNMESATNTLTQAKENERNAQSNVEQARINLSYAKIYSPIDGVVLSRSVDQGQTVAASFNTPTIFLIANDLTKMEVQANMDEADVGGLLVGQKATFTVDAYPDLTFDGTVSQIRLNPVTTNNVVTYTVIINAPNPDKKLFPGMTASITITIQEEAGLIVPMGALRFTPAPEFAKRLHVQLPAAAPAKAKGTGVVSGAGGAGAEKGQKRERGVWIQTAEDSIVYQPIEIGLNDGIYAIAKSGLHEGQKVVESVTEKKSKKNEAAANPLIPQRPGRNQNQNQRPAGGGGGGGR